MVYLFVYIILCLLVPFGAPRGRKNIALLSTVLAALVLFVGFRWQVGCDWYGYLNIFEGARQASLEEAVTDREPGFALLNVFVHYLGLEYFTVNVVGALLFFVGLYFFARREENPMAIVALSFPVLIVNMPMSGVRQGIAIGFAMLAINAYRDRRRLSYVGAVLAGSTFHQSALLFLGAAPLIGSKRSIVMVGLALLLTVPALYFLLSGTVGFYAERYAGDTGDAAGAPFRAGLLATVGLGFLVFMRSGWRKKHPDDYELYAIASALMVATLPITLFASIIGDRLGYYLVPFQLVIMARVATVFGGDKLSQLYALAPYLVLFGFFAAWMSASTLFGICYVPYQNILLGVN